MPEKTIEEELSSATRGLLKEIYRLMEKQEGKKREVEVVDLEDTPYRKNAVLKGLKEAHRKSLIEYVNHKNIEEMCKAIIKNREKNKEEVLEEEKAKIRLTYKGIYFTEGLFREKKNLDLVSN